MGNVSLEAVLGPIGSRFGQLEDPALNTLDSGTRGDCDVVLEDRFLWYLDRKEVGPHLEGGPNGAKVRPKREVRRFDSKLFHAIYEIILRFVGDTSVQSRRDVLEEYTAVQVRSG